MLADVDIALDPFPFNGHTTTCDAIWMGVPVVMLAGGSYASRFGGSVLQTVGLEHWIAESRAEYVEIAAGLAADLDALARFAASCAERMAGSALLDLAGFTRNVEAAYRQMWIDWCAAVNRPCNPLTQRDDGRRTPCAGERGARRAACRQILAADPRHAQTLHCWRIGESAARSVPMAADAASGRHAHRRPRERRVSCHADRSAPRQRPIWPRRSPAPTALVQLTPKSAELHFVLGRLLETPATWPRRPANFPTTLRLAPGHLEASLHLGQALLRPRQARRGRTQFEAAARSASAIAVGALRPGCRLPGTRQTGRGRWRLSPRDRAGSEFAAGALTTWEWRCDVLDRLPEAVGSLQAALRHTCPRWSRRTWQLGHVLPWRCAARRSRGRSARRLSLAPNAPLALAHLAAALQLQGELDGAIAAYRRAWPSNPANAAEHSNLLYCPEFHPRIDAAKLFAEHRAWAGATPNR